MKNVQAEYKAKSRKDYKLVALQMLDQGVKVLNKELNVSFTFSSVCFFRIFLNLYQFFGSHLIAVVRFLSKHQDIFS